MGRLRSELDSKYIEPTSYHYSLGSKLNFQLRLRVVVVVVAVDFGSVALKALLSWQQLRSARSTESVRIFLQGRISHRHTWDSCRQEIERNERPLEPWRASGKLWRHIIKVVKFLALFLVIAGVLLFVLMWSHFPLGGYHQPTTHTH